MAAYNPLLGIRNVLECCHNLLVLGLVEHARAWNETGSELDIGRTGLRFPNTKPLGIIVNVARSGQWFEVIANVSLFENVKQRLHHLGNLGLVLPWEGQGCGRETHCVDGKVKRVGPIVNKRGQPCPKVGDGFPELCLLGAEGQVSTTKRTILEDLGRHAENNTKCSSTATAESPIHVSVVKRCCDDMLALCSDELPFEYCVDRHAIEPVEYRVTTS